MEAAAWLPLDEYVSHQRSFHRDLPLYATMMERCVAYARGERAGAFSAAKLDGGLWKPRQDLLMWGADEAAAAGTADAGRL